MQSQISGSFNPDMIPSVQNVDAIPQDTLNLSNDISKDLIDLNNDQQFQDAFKNDDSKESSDKIFIQENNQPNFDEAKDTSKGKGDQNHDTLPLSNSIMDQVNYSNSSFNKLASTFNIKKGSQAVNNSKEDEKKPSMDFINSSAH